MKHIREFRLHRQEKFLYICDLLDMWEWELGVMDIQEVTATDAENPLPGRSWCCALRRVAVAPEAIG